MDGRELLCGRYMASFEAQERMKALMPQSVSLQTYGAPVVSAAVLEQKKRAAKELFDLRERFGISVRRSGFPHPASGGNRLGVR